jgi:hypothetical protein
MIKKRVVAERVSLVGYEKGYTNVPVGYESFRGVWGRFQGQCSLICEKNGFLGSSGQCSLGGRWHFALRSFVDLFHLSYVFGAPVFSSEVRSWGRAKSDFELKTCFSSLNVRPSPAQLVIMSCWIVENYRLNHSVATREV